MDFPVNALAEGRVLVPWEQRKYSNISKQDSSGNFFFLFHSFFLIRQFQPVSNQSLGANSKLTGPTMVTFGKLGGELAVQKPQQGGCIHPYDPHSWFRVKIALLLTS